MMRVQPGGYKYKKSEVSGTLKEYTKAGREFVTKSGVSAADNTNPEISRKGWTYIKGHVERDAHFRSVLDTRINSLISNGYKIMPAQTRVDGKLIVTALDREIAELVTESLERMSGCFETDMVAMMTHISRGFSLSEINYQYLPAGRFAGKVGLKNIRYKEPELFAFKFDELGYYSLNQIDPDNMVLDINKFVHMVNGFNDENPYGESLAAMCAFWVWLKENGAKFWSIFVERFGMPLAKLEVPADIKNLSEVQIMADEITDTIHETTAIQVPKGLVLSYMEAMRTGEANYRGYMEFANQEMSKLVLGSTLAVETQKNASGTHAAANTHENTMGKQLSFDIITSQAALNQQLIKHIVDFNYPGVVQYPHFVWKSFDVSGFITFAQGVEALLRSGAKIPAAWINEVTSIPFGEEGEELLQYLPNVAAAAPGGVDNKAFSFLPQRHKGPQSSFERLSDKSEPVRYAQDKTEKDAKAADKDNTRLINEGKAEITRRWEAFAEEIATSGKFDAQNVLLFEQNEIGSVMSQFLFISHLKGILAAKNEVGLDELKFNKNRGRYGRNRPDGRVKMYGGEYIYKPFDAVLADFRKRKLLSKDEFDRLEKEFQRQAFTVANNDSNYVLKIILQELTEVLAGRADLPDFYDRVIGIFERAGVIGEGWHIETVLRTNLQTQYIDGREKVFGLVDAGEYPQKQVVCVLDSATRPHHQVLNKFTRAVGDPIWSWLKPPFDYNCRCTLRLVIKTEQLSETEWSPDRGQYGLL